jgi:putative membrane protein
MGGGGGPDPAHDADPVQLRPRLVPRPGDSWEAAHLAARDVAIGKTIAAYAVVQAAVFVAVLLITCVPAVLRLVTPRRVRRARVRRAAMQQFLAHGLHTTRGRTGVLIFASLSDRQVEIVADEGIHSRVDAEVWATAVDALTRALRAGRAADGFETAIGLTGDVLASHFPPRANNPDELPNRLVEI